MRDSKGRYLKGNIMPEEVRAKIGASSKGRVMSVEARRKISIAHKGKPRKGTGHLGHKHSDEAKRKIALGRYKKYDGEKSPRWKGGVSKDKTYKREKYREWTQKNYEKKLSVNRQRRIMKFGNGGFHSLSDWQTLKAQYNWTCPCCKKSEPEIVLTEDHIIPVTKGGSDNIENIQPLCRSCNSRKHDKIINFNK